MRVALNTEDRAEAHRVAQAFRDSINDTRFRDPDRAEHQLQDDRRLPRSASTRPPLDRSAWDPGIAGGRDFALSRNLDRMTQGVRTAIAALRQRTRSRKAHPHRGVQPISSTGP